MHVDNGWNSEKAVGNIKRILDPLRIDLSTVVLNWKEFRDLQLAFLRASTPDSEIPSDHAIVASFYGASSQHRVGYCMSGINFRTEGIHVREWSQGHLDSRYIRSIYKQFTGKRLKHFPLIPITTLVRNIALHRPQNVFLLDYLDYDKAAAKRLADGEIRLGGLRRQTLRVRLHAVLSRLDPSAQIWLRQATDASLDVDLQRTNDAR